MTFIAESTGEYMFFLLNIHVKAPDVEDVLDMATPVRQAVDQDDCTR